MPEQDSLSKWHFIRPWHPRLSLFVKEITSVSATFVIVSLAGRDHFEPNDGPTPTSNQSVVPDPLSKGVSVKVNGTPWPKCLARLSDNADEAMIIVYGLMPGRHYDIELGLIAGEKLRGQIVTESIASDGARSNSDSTPQVGVFSSTASHSLVADHSPSPPSPSPPSTPSGGPSYSSQTFEDYLGSLRLSLSHLQTEHETLSNSLKSARRDSQKAQAAQRTEISSLKRAAQKHSAGDTRMRQKVRALEEAVKQTVKGREDVEAEYTLLDATRVEQEAELADALRRFEEARIRAEEWRTRREKAEEETGNKLQGAKAELAAVEARLEKLRAKRERLEGRPGEADGEDDDSSNLGAPASGGGLVGELEAKLREMSLERERIEADPCGQVIGVPLHCDEAEKSADARAPGHTPPGHNRHSARSKRSAHSHQHSHSRAATHSSPTSASTARQSPTLQRSHTARGSGSGSGKGSIARRKSSPPPHSQVEKSALSLNAPPFEPSSIKGKGNRGGR
ncbi:hypothetical protein EDB87DRAFT_1604676 [Lactarius vividus]|nr:hypothetical protein EDB87DRAFT_1604676 [Lactarius vividus]